MSADVSSFISSLAVQKGIEQWQMEQARANSEAVSLSP